MIFVDVKEFYTNTKKYLKLAYKDEVIIITRKIYKNDVPMAKLIKYNSKNKDANY